MYRWYCKEAGFSGPEYDNFCRFGRIIFIWAPLLWFYQKIFCTKLFGPVRLWMVLFGLAYVAFAVFQPKIAVVLGIWTVIGVVFWGLISNLFGEGVVYKFFIYGGGVLRIWVLLVVAALGAFAYFAWAVFLKFLLVLAIYAVVLIAVFGLIAGVSALLSRREKRLELRTRKSGGIVRNVGGAVSVGWHWLVLLKRKTICPWVSMTPDGYIQFYWSEDAPAEQELS